VSMGFCFVFVLLGFPIDASLLKEGL